MKPLHIALLLAAGALGGAVVMKISQRPPRPAVVARNRTPPATAPAPAPAGIAAVAPAGIVTKPPAEVAAVAPAGIAAKPSADIAAVSPSGSVTVPPAGIAAASPATVASKARAEHSDTRGAVQPVRPSPFEAPKPVEAPTLGRVHRAQTKPVATASAARRPAAPTSAVVVAPPPPGLVDRPAPGRVVTPTPGRVVTSAPGRVVTPVAGGVVAPAPSADPAPAPQPVPPARTEPEYATPPPPAPPEPHRVTLNAGTLIPVRLVDGLSAERNLPGDSFTATLDKELVVDGFVIAERGARVEGRVAASDRGGRVKGVSSLQVELVRLHLTDGQAVALQTEAFLRRAEPTHNQDAARVGGGAALGAIIGAIAGGGKGAAIGAGAGGAAGAGDVIATRGKPATLPSETRVSFRLRAPVTITEKLLGGISGQ